MPQHIDETARPDQDEKPIARSERDTLAETFQDPPARYGPIDGYWWEGGQLDQDRLRWQLEELKDKGIAGTWFYARFLGGEPLGSDPGYFSDEWWDFTRFVAEEHRRLGMLNWTSNWTLLGFEQHALRAQRADNPSLWGRRLVAYEARARPSSAELAVEIDEGDEILDVAAYQLDGQVLLPHSRVDLADVVDGRTVRWTAPGPGWLLTVVATRRWDLDYLSDQVGQGWTEVVLGEYERRLPGLLGADGVSAYGPDEMMLLNGTLVFSDALLAAVRAEWGEDPVPYLIGLFRDIGPRTEQVRGSYLGAMTSLLDENFFQAPTRWLHDRGMQHVSLSQLNDDAVTHTFHYGDFFRYLRSFDAPGNEDPFVTAPGDRRLFRTKLSSSVAHLYQRERVVLCAHYATGWGHNLDENLAWTIESYTKGTNLYNRHLISYSLMGGWYEYVPPADHFYQPHWRYWRTFADYVRRLSFIMSQGQHRADVALLYPLTTLHAHWTGARGEAVDGVLRPAPEEQSTETVFQPEAFAAAEAIERVAEAIFADGIDFDFVDDDSFARATVDDGVLAMAGLEFRSVVLPPMTTVRRSTMAKIKAFHDDGGTVVAFGQLPYASVESGRDDPDLQALLDSVFASGSERGVVVTEDTAAVPQVLSRLIERDVITSEKEVFHTHQRCGDVDIYLVFNVRAEARELTVDLRATGRVEMWDAFTGEIRPVPRVRRNGQRSQLRLTLASNEGVVLVVSPDHAGDAVVLDDDLAEVSAVEFTGAEQVVLGYDTAGGAKNATVLHEGQKVQLQAEVTPAAAPEVIDGPFSFRLEPTMNNRWGDFRYPPSPTHIGAEARQFQYREEGQADGAELGWQAAELNDADWTQVTYSYGPYWWHLGPFEAGSEPAELVDRALSGDDSLNWMPYSYSRRFGAEQPVNRELVLGWFQHLLGVSDNFLVLDDAPVGSTEQDRYHYLRTTVVAPTAGTYTLRVGRRTEHPELTGYAIDEAIPYYVHPDTQAWVNGATVLTVPDAETSEVTAQVTLEQGRNSVLLRLVHLAGGHLSSYAVLLDEEPMEREEQVPLLNWYRQPSPLSLDVQQAESKRVGWYRFTAPPGLRELRMSLDADDVQAWVGGVPVPVQNGIVSLPQVRAEASTVALRVRQRTGVYAGAAFTEPVTFHCEEGVIGLGDWTSAGLASYSGIGVYGVNVTLDAEQAAHRVHLELGRVRSAVEVLVNGRSAGVKIAAPFTIDITEQVQVGVNRIDIEVANTLANHMSTYPTRWVFEGQTESGLIGPVRLRFATPVRLTAPR